ncbi:hypothetical protein HAX54_024225, partial [Datura stramonium]|nr:hypothetical protein [Datura stramonium]
MSLSTTCRRIVRVVPRTHSMFQRAQKKSDLEVMEGSHDSYQVNSSSTKFRGMIQRDQPYYHESWFDSWYEGTTHTRGFNNLLKPPISNEWHTTTRRMPPRVM